MRSATPQAETWRSRDAADGPVLRHWRWWFIVPRVWVHPTSRVLRRSPAAVLVVSLVMCASQLACHRSPTGPDEVPLATGRWTGDGACLSVTETGCNLAVGCGHGQFPRPS